MNKKLSKIFGFAIMGVLLFGINAVNAQADATLLWANGVGKFTPDGGDLEVKSIKLDALGNRYVTGFFSGTADFDPGVGSADLTSSGGKDIFFAKYSASSGYLWAKRIGSTRDDQGLSLSLDGSGNIVLTGSFNGTVDFDPNAASIASILNNAGFGSDIFLAKYSSSGTYLWANSMGGTSDDQGLSIAQDGSGNVFVTGFFSETVDFDPGVGTSNLSSPSPWDSNIFLAKYDPSGNYLWANSMGGSSNDQGLSLSLDVSGNVVVTGYFSETVDFDPGVGTSNLSSPSPWDSNIFLAKYDASGNYLWANSMGGTNNDQGLSLSLDGSSNVLVTGYFEGTADFNPSPTGPASLTSVGQSDVFLAKYDANGNYLWANRMGGLSQDQGLSLALDGNNNVLITGYFFGQAQFEPGSTTPTLTGTGSNDIFLAKYASDGTYLWAKEMGGSTKNDQGNSLALDLSNNLVVAGFFAGISDFDPSSNIANLEAFSGYSNGFMASITANGDYVAVSLLGGYEGGSSIESKSIVKDGSGNYYVAGFFTGSADFDPSAGIANFFTIGATSYSFLAKYDASGNYLWAKVIGGIGSIFTNSLALDGTGNLVVTGYFNNTADFDPSAGTANLTSAGYFDVFLAKYDANGNYLWANSFGGTGTDMGNSLALDASGNAVVTGYFENTADFDPSSINANLTSRGQNDIFIAKYDASGNYVWANNMGGNNTDQGLSLALDGSGNIMLTGSFKGTADFDPSAGTTANLTSPGYEPNIFLAKYDYNGIYLWANSIGGDYDDQGISIALDGSGNAVVTGYFNGTVDFDPSVAGTANLTTTGWGSDVFLAKYNSSGGFEWAKGFGGIANDQGQSLVLDGNDNVLITGNYYGTADFDPSTAGIANLTNAGGADIFLAKYDALGNYIWAKGIGASGDDYGSDLILDANGKVVVTGSFKGTVDFDPGAGISNLSTGLSGGQHLFIAAFETCINPTSGGTIATAQSGTSPFNPLAFTSTVAASGEMGTLEYKWQSSSTSNSAGFSDISSSNSATYDAGSLTITTWFKRLARVSCSADWTGTVESNVLEVTVSGSSTNTWIGTTSNLWNIATNWSLGTVPTSSDIILINTITPNAPQLNVDFTAGSSLTISGTGTLTVNAGKTLSVASTGTADFGGKLVTFKSDATGSAQFGQMLGTLSNASNATVERYIPASNRTFRLISSPVTTSTSIKYNWMENATLGVDSYPYASGTPQNPNAGYGTHITGSGGNTNGFDQTGSNNPSLFTHDNFSGTGAWNAVTATTGLLNAGDAYRIQIRGDRSYAMFASPLPAQSATTLRTTGALYIGSKTVNLNTTANGFSMIGNPYQATVDMYAAGITKTNITGYYYIWDPRMGTKGAYVSYGGGGIGSNNIISKVNQYLQPGQAVFVQTAAAGAASITFGESAKSIASNQSLVFSRFKGNAGVEFGSEPNAPQTTYTSLSTTLYYTDSLAKGAMPMDGMKVLFDNAFSNVVDQVDARKMYNLDETMSVLRDGTNLSIELMNKPDSTTVIPLNITQYRTQKYTMRMNWTNPYVGVNNKVTAYLKDKYTGSQYEINNILTTDIPYTIDAAVPTSFAADRFDIIFKTTALVVLPIAEIALTASVQQNGIKLQWTNPYDKDLSKYEVERSADGRVFTKVNTQSAGNGIQKNIIYNWFDATPIEGYNYYRIKGLALNNGKTQWSNNLKIRSWTVNIGTTIVPNPAERTGLNIKTDLPKGYYDMKLIDNRGRVVYTKGIDYNGLGGAIELRYGVQLAAGTYYLHIEGMGERVVRGVVVR